MLDLIDGITIVWGKLKRKITSKTSFLKARESLGSLLGEWSELGLGISERRTTTRHSGGTHSLNYFFEHGFLEWMFEVLPKSASELYC